MEVVCTYKVHRAFFLGISELLELLHPGPIVPRTRSLETGHPTEKRAAAIALQIEERGAHLRPGAFFDPGPDGPWVVIPN